MQTEPQLFLAHEARALLTRLDRIRPFALSEIMVPAANISHTAQRAIDQHLAQGRQALRAQVLGFVDALERDAEPAPDIQRRYALLRMRFNALLTQVDMFADALAQRGERDHGVWMAGLDALAADALALPALYEAPQVVCYLDRGIGAAIRRARTRLPGGGANPVALIRVPRERMVGTGVASSLVHEVGHQVAALLGLVDSLRADLRARPLAAGSAGDGASCWERWVSEILADFWAVARLGVAAPLGMIGVLSLPRAFVFRVDTHDPHPTPWLRVLLGCAMGRALYPHPQWQRLAALWQALYPVESAGPGQRRMLRQLAGELEALVDRLMNHRPPALRGVALGALAHTPAIGAPALRATFDAWQHTWRQQPASAPACAPGLACAALGQARADGRLAPEDETHLLARLLTAWALRQADAAPRVAAFPSH